MAIYSLHHSAIGKSTQAAPYTAAAHAKYITRDSAVGAVRSARMPSKQGAAMAFWRQVEDQGRKNARVMDKLLLALPRELSAAQRLALVEAFAENVTKSRAPWMAAIHDKGKDAHNPHCHLAIHDRDLATGKRVIGLSDAGSTNRLRLMWQEQANRALAAAGKGERIDRRTLKAQGIEREPTIHVGVRASELVRQRRKAVSRERIVINHCQARSRSRKVGYPAIDAGRIRLEHNVGVRRRNFLKSRQEMQEAAYWRAIDEDAFLRDITLLKHLHAVYRFSDDGRDIYRSREGPDRSERDR